MNVVSLNQYEIPSTKDNNQWLAGGDLKYNTFAGGSLYSPTSIPSFNNFKDVDRNYTLLNGKFLSFLNGGITPITSLINSWNELEILLDSTITNISVYKIDVEVVNTTTNESIYSGSSGEFSLDRDELGESISSFSTSQDKLTSFAMAMANRSDIRDKISNSPISMTLNLIDLISMETIQIEREITASALGTINGIFREMAVSAVSQMIGLVATSYSSMLGIALLGKVFDELFEMSLGFDNHFGYGGELLGLSFSANNQLMRTSELGFFEGVQDTLGNFLEQIGLIAEYISQHELEIGYYSSDMARFGSAVNEYYNGFTDMEYALDAIDVAVEEGFDSYGTTGGNVGGDVQSNAENTDSVFGTDYTDRDYSDEDGYGSLW